MATIKTTEWVDNYNTRHIRFKNGRKVVADLQYPKTAGAHFFIILGREVGICFSLEEAKRRVERYLVRLYGFSVEIVNQNS